MFKPMEETFRAPSGAPQNAMEDAHRLFRRGDLSPKEYEQANAVWVASHMASYPAIQPLSLSPALRAYIQARIQGLRERDPVLAIKVGAWTEQARKACFDHQGNMSLLLWAIEKLMNEPSAKGFLSSLVDQAEKLRSSPLPTQDMEDAHECQRRDVEDRRRNGE